jgi:hypothetical protein
MRHNIKPRTWQRTQVSGKNNTQDCNYQKAKLFPQSKTQSKVYLDIYDDQEIGVGSPEGQNRLNQECTNLPKR